MKGLSVLGKKILNRVKIGRLCVLLLVPVLSFSGLLLSRPVRTAESSEKTEHAAPLEKPEVETETTAETSKEAPNPTETQTDSVPSTEESPSNDTKETLETKEETSKEVPPEGSEVEKQQENIDKENGKEEPTKKEEKKKEKKEKKTKPNKKQEEPKKEKKEEKGKKKNTRGKEGGKKTPLVKPVEIKESNHTKEEKNTKEFSKKDTLIIGDSIAYGMSLNNNYTGVDARGDLYWLTEGGIGINFITKNLNLSMGRVMPRAVHNTLNYARSVDLVKEVKDKKIKNIGVVLGINCAQESYVKSMVEKLSLLKEKTGCNVYYISVLPIVDAKAAKHGYPLRDKGIAYFNSLVEKGLKDSGVVFVDAYKEVKKIPYYSGNTGDGIHYSKKVYNRVIKLLNKKIDMIEKQMKSVKKWKKQITGK